MLQSDGILLIWEPFIDAERGFSVLLVCSLFSTIISRVLALLIGNFFALLSKKCVLSDDLTVQPVSLYTFCFPIGGSIISNKESDCNPVIHLWKEDCYYEK